MIRLRIFCYERGILSKKRIACPVISIGNITTGGTGKTPFTIYLAEQWQKKGKKVGIVSRGYRRKNKAEVVLVSDGVRPLETPKSVGDEPYLIAERLKGVPVVVANDRYQGCRFLMREFKVDLILLDDGFQHIQLHRDQNILLIDATRPFGNGALLPRGPLREPVSEIRRADYVIFTRIDAREELNRLFDAVAAFGRPFIKSRFKASALIDLSNESTHPVSDLKGQSILVFCAIGNPSAFLDQLSRLGAKIKETLFFRDHHFYNEADIVAIKNRSETRGLKRIVTTEKDAVKLKNLSTLDLDIWVLRVDVDFLEFSKDQEALLFKI